MTLILLKKYHDLKIMFCPIRPGLCTPHTRDIVTPNVNAIERDILTPNNPDQGMLRLHRQKF